MLEVAVLQDLLTVIRGHHDDRALGKPELVQDVEQPPDHGVRVVQRSVVAVDHVGELRVGERLLLRVGAPQVRQHLFPLDAAPLLEQLEILGRSLELVHRVSVREQEERLLRVFPEPPPDLVRGKAVGELGGHLGRRPAHPALEERRATVLDRIDLHEAVESAVEAEVGGEIAPPGVGLRAIPVVPEDLREDRGSRRGDQERPTLDPVHGGELTGEHADVRGQGVGRLGRGVLEQDRGCRKAVDLRSRVGRVPVGPHVIRAHGVERDDDHVHPRRLGGEIDEHGGAPGFDHRSVHGQLELHLLPGPAREIHLDLVPGTVDPSGGNLLLLRVDRDAVHGQLVALRGLAIRPEGGFPGAHPGSEHGPSLRNRHAEGDRFVGETDDRRTPIVEQRGVCQAHPPPSFGEGIARAVRASRRRNGVPPVLRPGELAHLQRGEIDAPLGHRLEESQVARDDQPARLRLGLEDLLDLQPVVISGEGGVQVPAHHAIDPALGEELLLRFIPAQLGDNQLGAVEVLGIDRHEPTRA